MAPQVLQRCQRSERDVQEFFLNITECVGNAFTGVLSRGADIGGDNFARLFRNFCQSRPGLSLGMPVRVALIDPPAQRSHSPGEALRPHFLTFVHAITLFPCRQRQSSAPGAWAQSKLMAGVKSAFSSGRYDWNMSGKHITNSGSGRNWFPYIKYGTAIVLAAFAVWILFVAVSR